MQPVFVLFGCIVVACLLGCVPANDPPRQAEATSAGIDLNSARLVDLSYPYDEDTLFWPTSPSEFELDELAYGNTEQGYFYSAYSFSMPEHGGTHIDAPIHFAENGWTTGAIPLRRLLAPGIVIDISDAASADPDVRLSREQVLEWEQRNGNVPEGAVVILRTGWGSRWPDAMVYLGDDTKGDASNLHFPAYGEDAARLLVEERRVGGLGIDTASIDYGQSTDFIVHQIAAAANVFNLENVANVGDLPETGFWVIALPIKIARGSGGPVRVVAVLP
jgi:kynurenine formamidase